MKMASKISLTLPGGAQMPSLGLGTFLAKSDEEIETSLNTALEAGYRHIDTAWAYENEPAIGRVLQRWFCAEKLKREDLFITTKLPMIGVHPDRVELFMKKSLANLQLDYVDLYLVHFPVGCKYQEGIVKAMVDENGEVLTEPKTDHVALWKKMEEQVETGRARHIGLSNYNISQIETVLKSARIKPANLQVELHVFFQQRQLRDFCSKNGITIVAYFPLGNPGLKNMKSQRPDVLGNLVVNRLSQKYSKTPAQIVLRFLIQIGVSTIPKSVTPKRIRENIDIFDFNIEDGDMQQLYDLNIGEDARIADFKTFKGFTKHPDYPIKL